MVPFLELNECSFDIFESSKPEIIELLLKDDGKFFVLIT